MRCDAMLDGRRVISAHAVPSCKLLHVARPFANAHARRRLGADDVMLGARFRGVCQSSLPRSHGRGTEYETWSDVEGHEDGEARGST